MALVIVQQLHQLVVPCKHIGQGPQDWKGPASLIQYLGNSIWTTCQCLESISLQIKLIAVPYELISSHNKYLTTYLCR